MRRLLKISGILVALLAALLILAVVVINLVPGKQYKNLVSSVLKDATGRDLVIEGDLDITLFTAFSFTASDVKFVNAEWGSRPHMLTIDRIEGEVALFPLIKGIIDVSLVVDRPDLLLETHSSGRGNWHFGEVAEIVKETVEAAEKVVQTKAQTDKVAGLPLRLRIRKLQINDTRFAYNDSNSEDQIKIRSERLHVGSTEEKVNLDLKGQFKGIPLALSGSLDNANIMIDNKPSNVGFDGHFGEAKLVVRGTAGPLVPAVNLDITVDVNTDSVAVFSPLAGQELPNLGPLSVSFKLAGKQGRYSLSELLAQLKDQTLTAEARGSITDLANLSGLKVQVWVNTGQMAKLMKKLGIRTDITLPDSVKAEVVTEGNLNELALKQFKADIQGRGFSATGSGQAKNIITLDGAKASFTVEAESLDFIAGIAKTKLPSLGPLKASANITSTGKNLEAMEIDANLASDKIQANVSGSVVDPINLKKVNAVVDLGIESFDWLSEYIETKLPPLGALKASAKIVSKGKTFEVKEINADLTGGKIQAKMAGSVKDVLKLAGINANVNFNADSLAALNPIVKAELPASGPVTLEAKISSKGVLKGPATIATVFKGDGVTAKLSGSIAEPLSAKGIDMAIAIEADSLEKVGTLAAINLKGKNPLKLEGRLIGSEKSYELAGLRLQSDGLDIKGQAAYKLPTESGGRPKATGQIHVGTLDLPKLQGRQATPSPEKESSPESRDDESKPKKVFSSEPLPFGTLKALDANFHLTVESLTTLQLLLEDGEANLVLENGLLNIKPIRARVGQGQLVGYVTLDAGKKPAFLDVDVELTDGTFRNFGGKTHFLVDLKGSGDSIASIMAGLDGHLEFDVRGATLKKSFMTKFGTGLLDSLNPLNKQKDTTQLDCAIVLFDINKGILDANKKIAGQMTDITYFGSGEINLKTEEIDFGVSPKPRKGLGLSLGGLAKLVHVGGTLAEPKIQLDPKDLAVKYGKYTAAVATGGLSLVVDTLWSRIKANTDVCDSILKELEQLEAEEKAKKAE